jgi:4-amino-4-deoxy-L-arabinose transferase-like glycosyltransferase
MDTHDWRRRLREWPRQRSTATLLLVVLGWAAVLRLDAITLTYGDVTSPSWVRGIQQLIAAPARALRPASVTWEPAGLYPHRHGPPTRYRSDPYTYLGFAREMRSFYAAHQREPLFPFTTKVFLVILNDQDVAVSFASALFSVLAVLAVYLLGARAWSTGVGLGAATLAAIDYDMISTGIEGFRDDAFTTGVALSAYALIRYGDAPTRRHAILLGVCGAAACLTRLTSVTFLVPGVLAMLVLSRHPWRQLLPGTGLAALTVALLVGPFVVNCWRAFGDPLYAINYHVRNVQLTVVGPSMDGASPLGGTTPDQASLGQGQGATPSAGAFYTDRVRQRPFQTLETVVLGMSSHPFGSKWRGLDRWWPGLGRWLSWAAVAGLLLFLGSRNGGLLLVVLAASLLPSSLIWRLWPDWRFTQHAYPFFLIAACVCVETGLRAARSLPRWRAPRWSREAGLTAARWAVVLLAVAVVGWTAVRGLPVWAAREALASGEDLNFGPGGRDKPFVADGWSDPFESGAVRSRVSQGPFSTIRVPLPRVDNYSVTLRLDPFPRPVGDVALPAVRVFLNGVLVGKFNLTWDPNRVGAYHFTLPQAVVSAGSNTIALVVDRAGQTATGHAGTPSVSFWYLRVRPPAQ